MCKRLTFLLFGALTLLMSGLQMGTAYAAEVFISEGSMPREFNYKPGCTDFLLVVRGDMTPGDGARLTRAIQEVESRSKDRPCADKFLRMQLLSDGGSVEAAMELGRVIRKYGMEVIVPTDSHCFSSCVLALAAGADRLPFGRIGIHRPYFGDLSNQASIEEIRKRQNAVRLKIRSYLAEMDVSPTLMDLMLSIPPEKVRILSKQELSDLRLTGKDPSFEEREIARQAKFWGLTSSEYRARSEVVSSRCRKKSGIVDSVCQIQIMLRVSRAEAERRYAASDKCLDVPNEAYFECSSGYVTGRRR